MTRVSMLARSRWSLASLCSLMLVLMMSPDAFAACPSAFSFDFNGAQYTECFRDALRAGEINAGTDLAGTGHTALNFTGSAASAPSTWLTVYDAVPAVADAGPTFGAETLCADVLIRTAGNVKGAGVVALLNEGTGRKGLAVHISNAGNTDTLILSTVDGDPVQKGKLTTLTSVSLQGSVVENKWYRVVMTVDPAATPKVTGQVFTHGTATDPNSGPLTQVGGTLTYNLLPAGVTSPGQNAIIANAIAASVNSSVTNFSNDPVKCGVSGPPPPPPPSTAGFPATGQTTCWTPSRCTSSGCTSAGVVPCAGTGQDGDIRAGRALSYTDNGDGTITDNNTGLMWEKKSLEGTTATNINRETTYRGPMPSTCISSG